MADQEIASVSTILSVVGAPQSIAELIAYRDAVKGIGGQSVTLKTDTSAVTRAQGEVATLGTAHQALGARPVALGMDMREVEQARTSVKNLDNDLLSLVGTASKVAPAFSLAVVAGGLTKFAADYQTTLITTANQTNMTTKEIATMDQTIRQLPSAGASLQSLASGFKNITDLGYSAADAQRIANEESKAATATGSDQATTMLATTSAMKEYNATASEVAKYSNIVTEAARLGNTTLNAWTEGTRTGVAVAAAYGVSLQEADAFMVALTRHGFDASESATQLRGVIQHIVNESPKVDAEIQKIKAQTGIDLTPDFGADAIKTQGFTKIMQDLQDVVAKTGDESIVTKLIPALRGGQGALITVTQAAADSKDALVLLGQAADGSLTPVEDGFARIQQTAGYQFGQTMKQLKLDLIDVGQEGLPAVTAIAKAFGDIPAPAITAAVHLGEVALAVKAASAVGDLLTTTWAKMGASTATATAANAAETTMTTEAAAATTSLTTALTLNTEAILANTVAKEANVATADAMLATVPGFTLAMASEAETTLADTVATEANTAAKLANNAARLSAIGGGLLAGGAPLVAGAEALTVYPKVLGDLKSGDIKQAIGDLIKYEPATPWGLFNTGKDLLGFGGKSQSDAQQQAATNSAPGSGAAPTIFTDTVPPEPSEAEIASMEQHYDLLYQKRDELLAKGAPAALVNHALFPEDFGESKEQLASYTRDLTEWQRQYAEAQKAATSAQSALGKIDLGKGLQTLTTDLPTLTKASDTLAKLGQTTTHLDNLTAIGKQFQAVTEATDAASLAYTSYTELLTNTNQLEGKLGSYKKELDAGVASAQDAVLRGTATPEQVQLLRDAPNIYAHINEEMGKLEAHKAGDLLSIASEMPDWAKADTLTRNVADNLGGIKAVNLTVQAETDKAKQDIETLIKGPYTATVLVKTVMDGSGGSDTNSLPLLWAAGPLDATRGYGDNGGGTPPAAIATPTSAGGTATPRGDASALLPYKDMIAAAAQEYGVPEWLIGAAIMHESGGTAGVVNPSSGAAGLMQVYTGPGGNPQYAGDMNSLRGKDPTSASVQINDGTAILAAFLKQYGGDAVKALQGYAGTDYASSSDPSKGVQGGLNFYAELTNYYKAAVQNALGSGVAASGPSSNYGAGAGSYPARTIAGSENLTTQQNLQQMNDVGNTEQAIIAAAKQHLGDPDVLVNGVMKPALGWCDAFVNNIVQQATGVNTRFADADTQIRDAIAKGKTIDQSQARPGDLVGWTGDNPTAGDAAGHIGIYSGNNKYIGTTANGIQERDLPLGGRGAVFIRPDGVVANGPEPGTTMYKYPASTVANSEHLTTAANQQNGTVGTIDYTKPGNPAFTSRSLVDLTNQSRVLKGILEDLTPKGGSDLITYFDKVYASEKTAIEEGMKAQSPTGTLTKDRQTAANNQALSTSADLTILAGNAMRDMETHSGNVADDIQKIRDQGGPIAGNLAEQVSLYGEIQANTEKIAQDQASITSLELANTQRKEQERVADENAARQKTKDGWTQELSQQSQQLAQRATQYGWTLDTQRLDARKTAEARTYEDANIAEDRSHTLKMRNLDDQLKAAEKLQKTADSGNSALEQSLSYQAKGPGDLTTKFQGAELLAIQKDFDSRNRQTLSDQIAAIKDSQVAETRLYEDDKYHRDQAHLTATRNFADEETKADINHTRIQQQWQQAADAQWTLAFNTKVKDQKAAWDLQDQRNAADALFTTNKATAEATLKSDQDHGKKLDEQLVQIQSIDGLWSKVYASAGDTANALLTAFAQITDQASSAPSGPAPIRKLGQSIPAGNYGIQRGA